MGREAIIEKLDKELRNDIKNECRVVYILSRVRKILDYEKADNKILRFYCNWVLHINLEHKNTTLFISKMFDSCIDFSKSEKDIAREMKSCQSDFFKLNDLKDDLRKFFENHDLPLFLVNKNRYWINFIKLLLEIIEECPVICIGSSEKIRSLELVKNDKGTYCYKFSLTNSKNKPVIKLKFKSNLSQHPISGKQPGI
ncbi:MAG: hypothetical protein Q8L09_01080 [Candidatus Moranbacteria bacterium]|nr:hypothetical protein [Candidatus Moranbacteria bacterium]